MPVAIELLRFLIGILILLIPGICLARILSLGKTRSEILATGSSLSLALSVYLASALSHIDLRVFYPVWAILALVCIVIWIRLPLPSLAHTNRFIQLAMILVLLLVAITRFALAIPRILPPGSLDPTFHLILAKQIQLTHHSIDHWPFANIPLNYPTGSHTLVVILSTLTGLPLHTTFKNLIPFLGILTTAQLYVFTRRITPDQPLLALYAAAIYGLCAWYGSIDYFRWGGLPNELAMLLFLAMLTIAISPYIPGNSLARSHIPIAICFAATILVHHHMMVVGGVILILIVLWQFIHHEPWRSLAFAAALGVFLDIFFLLPYAFHLSNFHSTGMAASGEPPLPLTDLPQSFGYALTALASVGILLCFTRRIRCHPVVAIASISLLTMFVIGEDIIPLTLRALGKPAFTFFTPSRFVTDLNYFLPIFAASAILFFQRKFRFPGWIAMLFILIAPLVDFQKWTGIFAVNDDLPQPILTACDWIQHNTPVNTLVDNSHAWMTYLCWREPAHMALPVSEPTADYHPASEKIAKILANEIPPDPPDLHIVAIRDRQTYTGGPILWQDLSGFLVVQEWPITTSSSSVADTPAPKPPGPPPASAPASP